MSLISDKHNWEFTQEQRLEWIRTHDIRSMAIKNNEEDKSIQESFEGEEE